MPKKSKKRTDPSDHIPEQTELPASPPKSPQTMSSHLYGTPGAERGNASSDDENAAPKPPNVTGAGLPVAANTLPKPATGGTVQGPAGSLLKGPITAEGKQKDPLILVGIKLDLEADIHVNVRVRGDVMVGLY